MSFYKIFGRLSQLCSSDLISSHQMTTSDPYWHENITFLPNLTLSNMSFCSFLDSELIALISFEFWVTKWPSNDLMWPILTKHNFTDLLSGACMQYVFLWGFWDTWVVYASQIQKRLITLAMISLAGACRGFPNSSCANLFRALSKQKFC